MEAAAAPRALSLLGPSPPMRTNCSRVAFGGGARRQGAVAVSAKKKRGRGGDGGAEERVDTHSFAPKAGEAAGLFPEAVLLRKVRSSFFHATRCFLTLLVFKPWVTSTRAAWNGCSSAILLPDV